MTTENDATEQSIQPGTGDGPAAWGSSPDPAPAQPAKRPPGRPPGTKSSSANAGGKSRPAATPAAGKASTNLVVPLTDKDGIAWGSMGEEKAARVVSIFGSDGKIRGRVQGGGPALDPAALELADVVFGLLSAGMVSIGKMRGMHDEAAILMALREDQVKPIRAPAAREISKYIGPVSDLAMVGMGIAMAALSNWNAANAKQQEIAKAGAAA